MQLGSKNIARLICAQDVTVSFSQEVIMVKLGSLLAIPPYRWNKTETRLPDTLRFATVTLKYTSLQP